MSEPEHVRDIIRSIEARLYAPAIIAAGLNQPLRSLVQFVRSTEARIAALEAVNAQQLASLRALQDQRAALAAAGDRS